MKHLTAFSTYKQFNQWKLPATMDWGINTLVWFSTSQPNAIYCGLDGCFRLHEPLPPAIRNSNASLKMCARERISRNNRPIERRYKSIILCGPTCCMLVDYPLYKSHLKLTNLQICTWSKLKIVLFWHEIVSFPVLQTQNSSQQLSSLDPKKFHKYFNLIFLPSIKTTSAHKVDDIINIIQFFPRKLMAF